MNDKPAFDFGQFADCVEAQQAGREIEIVDVKGNKTGVFFMVHGIESQRYADAMKEVELMAIEDRKLRPTDDDDRVTQAVRLMARCVSAWRTGNDQHVLFRGQKLDCSVKNREMIMRASQQIRGQVFIEVNNAAGFMKG